MKLIMMWMYKHEVYTALCEVLKSTADTQVHINLWSLRETKPLLDVVS